MHRETRRVVCWGETEIRLRNYANVDGGLLEQVVLKSGLQKSSKQLLLILDNENGFGFNENRRRGSTFPSILFRSGNDPSIRGTGGADTTEYWETDSYTWKTKTIDMQERSQWDTLVYLPGITTEKCYKFRPYFAYVLAHELAHVKILRENLDFHLCVSWLYEHHKDIFEEAGRPSPWAKTWHLPWELNCHRRGREVSVELFGEQEFRQSIRQLIKEENEKHRELLWFVLGLRGSSYRGNVCEVLLKEIVEHYNDSVRQVAHRIWEEEHSRGCVGTQRFELSCFIPE